jgi:chain length determinant protein (polysaccharide antigen chain regulator)
MQSQSPPPIQSQEDEIDLLELVSILWHRKWLIIGVASMAIALAVLYLFITPKVYEAKAFIGETPAVNIAQLNQTVNIAQLDSEKTQLGSSVQSVSPESAYALFQKKLQSRSLALTYFKEEIEPVYRNNGSVLSDDTQLGDTFLKSIALVKPSVNSIYLAVKYQYTDPVLSAKWLNGYLRFVDQKTKEELINSAQNNRLQALNEYEKEIISLRKIYSRKLQDKIIRLSEASKIARKLNIQKPLVSNITVNIPSGGFDENLLYMKGYEVLNAEIDTLKTRELHDPYIENIRPIQENISYLDSLEYDISTLEVINVDAWAAEPVGSIKPKKALVLVLAGLLGGMIGIFVALVSCFLARRNLG